MSPLQGLKDYSLVICEKPDAAKRIAEALGEGKVETKKVDGIEVYYYRRNGRDYLVCSALGHLYTIVDPAKKRSVYPVLDVCWAPKEDGKESVKNRIEAIRRLAQGAKEFIHSCDFDIEGETIGYNILKYACGGKEKSALRAKFSTLTHEELRAAFDKASVGLGMRLAEAGRTRHMVDFIWGVNLSRALSESFYTANKRFRVVSVGRVQGPTLRFVVDREIEIRTFVPTPYWSVRGVFGKAGSSITAFYERDKLSRYQEALAIRDACLSRHGLVKEVKAVTSRLPPPFPFNLGDLQKEAYRVFGFSPSLTLSIAERLYLDALISYPRTSSQKLPSSIGFPKIMASLAKLEAYSEHASELLKRELIPREGPKEDPAHPAIYPTGELPKRELEHREAKLFDLIVRRFFSVFGEDALRERVTAIIAVNSYNFKVSGRRTVYDGWIRYYGPYSSIEDVDMPRLEEGEIMPVLDIILDEKFEQRPPRYNQSSLLERMEREEIGTKTTRAEIIKTLYDRGYATGEAMVATDIGFTVVELMKEYCPSIISTEMTRDIERELERIELDEVESSMVLERAADRIIASLEVLKELEAEVGLSIREATISSVRAQNLLGDCPVCKKGKLTVIRSTSSGKRFVGCTSYNEGCRASAPLPQKGMIKPMGKACQACGWPMITVKTSRRIPWRLCVNLSCPARGGRISEVRSLQERGRG